MSCFLRVWDELDYSYNIILLLDNILTYHIPFLSYVVLFRYLRWAFTSSPSKHTFITLSFLLKCKCLCSLGEFFFSWNKTFYQFIFSWIAFFWGVPKENTLFLYSDYPGRFWGSSFFWLDNIFYLVSFLLCCMIFRALGKHSLLRLSRRVIRNILAQWSFLGIRRLR